MEEVEALLAENQAKADMILQTNPGVIEAYNERKAQVFCYHFNNSRLKN